MSPIQIEASADMRYEAALPEVVAEAMMAEDELAFSAIVPEIVTEAIRV